MQLQIENVCSQSLPQPCVICSRPFQPNLARVIVYTDDEAHGVLCPTCLSQGASFIQTCLQQIVPNDRISDRAA